MKIVWCGILILLSFLMHSYAAASEGRVALLPFENISGQANIAVVVMPKIRKALEGKGYSLLAEDDVEKLLHENRIRKTSGISIKNARIFREKLGVEYIVVGGFHLSAVVKDNPQFGLSAKIVSSDDASILWAESAGATGDDFTRILGFGTIKSMETLIARVVDSLFRSLPHAGHEFNGKHQVLSLPRGIFRHLYKTSVVDYFKKDELKGGPPLRVAVMPFENLTERAGSAKIVTNVFVTELFKAGIYDVVELGEADEKVIEGNVWVYGGVNYEGIKRLGKELKVDAIIIGSVETYNEGLKSETTLPEVELYARMLSAREGEDGSIIWTCHSFKRGKDTQIVLEFGIVKSMVPLVANAIKEMVGTL